MFFPMFGAYYLNAQSTFTIHGQLPSVRDTQQVYLYYPVASGKAIIDSTSTHEGEFSFKGSLSETVKGTLWLTKRQIPLPQVEAFYKSFLETIAKEKDAKNWGNDVLSVYVTPGVTEVYSKGALLESLLSGNPLNSELSQLQQSRLGVTVQKMKLLRHVSTLSGNAITAADKTTFDSTYNSLTQEDFNITLHYVQSHRKSKVSLDALISLYGQLPDDSVAATLKLLDSSLQPLQEYVSLSEQLKNKTQLPVGSVAPEFAQKDTSGHLVKLSDFNGRYVLIDFWASWCAPCRVEIPKIKSTLKEYKNVPLSIIAISLDRPGTREKWMNAIHTDGTGIWTQLSDLKGSENEVSILYHISSIPSNVLIDPHGKIIAKNLHGEALTQFLKHLFTTTEHS